MFQAYQDSPQDPGANPRTAHVGYHHVPYDHVDAFIYHASGRQHHTPRSRKIQTDRVVT